MAQRLRDTAADLLLGGRCAGCGTPGALLCDGCRSLLPRRAGMCWPDPTPPGLAPPYAVAVYEGLVRDLVLGHKERGLSGLRGVLGDLLARSVDQALRDVGAVGPVLLVPVPTRAASARTRGRDPLLEITRAAAVALAGHPARAGSVVVGRLLRSRPGVVDQAGLDAAHRRANLAGSMACRPGALRRLAQRWGAAHVVVCDDVLTTGSTAREAQRALEAVGLTVLAVATVAATPRRGRPRSGAQGELLGESSAGFLSLAPARH